MSLSATQGPVLLALSIKSQNKMAGWRIRQLFLSVCVVSLLGVQAEPKDSRLKTHDPKEKETPTVRLHRLETPVGRLFTYQVLRETFINDFPQTTYTRRYDDPMVFKCNLMKHPDLPEWLRFTQRTYEDNGFLYGTPTSPGKSVVEIYAINKLTFDVSYKDMITVIIVSPDKMQPSLPMSLPYQAEFFLGLREIEKALPSGVQNAIKQDLQKLWKTDDLEIVNISSALDRGGRVPLPLPGHYEGVYVKVGSQQHFSECLVSVNSPDNQRRCTADPDVRVPKGCNFCRIPGNCITWCKTELFDLSSPQPPLPAPTLGSGILESGGDFNPPDSPPERDFLPDYLVTVIVPLVLAIILCVLLAYIMCCRREGVEKRNAKTSEIQMYHHHTIHGNLGELRNLAAGRGMPHPPLSTLPMFNARTGERAPPLQSDSIPLIMAQQ